MGICFRRKIISKLWRGLLGGSFVSLYLHLFHDQNIFAPKLRNFSRNISCTLAYRVGNSLVMIPLMPGTIVAWGDEEFGLIRSSKAIHYHN